ncbi:MAG: UDP-N-acetylmuramoyl-L-alanyl-D-glutamate--2,6-diaminopimelate ligase [Verrucomicrobia bacterium]|nr:MAG: UDP-N-acetylmuramoyl-L-alanyl-D-glutamate--2,6-diaminopimelate ligase [Verrucomicrobiota bacterium]
MIVRELIADLSSATVSGDTGTSIEKLTASSREVGPGVLFAAIRGTQLDGHQFIEQAIAAGCCAILAEKAPPKDFQDQAVWIHVSDSRAALSKMASRFFGDPWREMKMAGVTGTNGKTTTAYLLHHVMKKVWHRSGLLGTILVDDGESMAPARHTTPGSIELSEILKRMLDHSCRGVAMEVSSHGIHQKRVSAIGFDACIFTNLTQDHLDYHGTMEAYFQAKADWFHALAQNPLDKKPVAIINRDDAYGEKLIDALDGKMPVIRFGFGVHCDFRGNNFQQTARGMSFELTAKGKSYLVRSPLIGRFNAYNLLGAIAAATACGIRPREVISAIAETPQVPGRMENAGNAGGATVFIDYAHTPDALINACRTLRELSPRRLITVFGCGGDRDRGKRPLMGEAASTLSDVCVVTSDNPRSEDPSEIIREIQSGMVGNQMHSIVDRAEAIDFAVQGARSGDIILIAGKGHEATQQFADRTIDFDDRKHASKALRSRSESISDRR